MYILYYTLEKQTDEGSVFSDHYLINEKRKYLKKKYKDLLRNEELYTAGIAVIIKSTDHE